MKERMRMDNKIKLRITRYQRLAMEHAKTIEEAERLKTENLCFANQLEIWRARVLHADKELQRVERERDAALSDLEKICKGFNACWRCKHYTAADTLPAACVECNNRGKERNWEWRGVQEVEEDA